MQLFTPALVLLLPVALACDAGVFCAAVAPRHRPALPPPLRDLLLLSATPPAADA